MQFQYYCGLRISEVLSITPANIKIDLSPGGRSEIRVMGKGSKERIVPIIDSGFLNTLQYINSDSIDPLEPYIKKDRRTMWAWYKKAAIKTGLFVTTHIFRHSFARNLLLKSVPINTVSLLLGHSYLSTTITNYLQLVPSTKELARAWEQLKKEE